MISSAPAGKALQAPGLARRPRRAGWRLLAGTGLVLLAACGESRRAPDLPVTARGPRVDVFLRASGSAVLEVALELEAVRLRDASGAEVGLALRRGSVSSSEASRRIALAGGAVPAGSYQALIVELRDASLRRAGVSSALRLLPPEGVPPPTEAEAEPEGEPPSTTAYELPLRLVVGRRDALSVFLEWNVDASLPEPDGLRLALGVSQERPGGRLGLLYVADAATGSVLSFERATGEVVGSVAAGPRPRALASERVGSRLYAAVEGDGSLSVLDSRTGWTRFSIPIQLAARTSDVVVVEPGRLVAACNPGVDSISVFDVGLLTRLYDVRVGREPVRLVFAELPRRLFVIEALSDTMSVVSVESRTVVASLPVGREPSAIDLDRRGREVFVGHRGSPDLLVFDAATLAPGPAIPVGGDVTAVLADVRRERVFVARARPPEIAVVDRRLGAVLRRIPIRGPVEALAQPLDGSLLYGAAPELGALIVVNVLRGREEAPLACGTAPIDVVAAD